jgi:hypothetical protein
VGGRPSDAPPVPPPVAATVEPAKLKPKKFGKQATPAPDRDAASERPGLSPSVPRLRAVPPPPADAPSAHPAARAPASPALDDPARTQAPSADLEATSADDEASSADRDDPPVVVPDAKASRPAEPISDVVVLSETTTSEATVETDSSSDQDASVPDRLVEPASGHPSNEVDPGTIRARLARTAALKKPGSRERRERDRRGSDDAP